MIETGFYHHLLTHLYNAREVLINDGETLEYADLLYAVCLLRLLREFDTLLSIYIMNSC